MTNKYYPKEIENKWYKIWEEKKIFYSRPNELKQAYSIVMPPPNITGILHMGHMLNNTIQDALARRARMLGKEVCWVPGTDHASIATEAKVVNMLKEEYGIEKNQLSREDFLAHVWKWKDKYGNTIIKQLKKIGCSCDWSRLQFTMDNKMYKTVQDVFIKLYERNLIYKGERMIYWDPTSNTALSDDEVIYYTEQTELVYIKYKIADTEDCITVATTRPETIFGDTAICINPNDLRYSHLRGKFLIIPIIGKKIPIIFDSYVDQQFGSGCLKVTPAHDMNDYILAKKHNLEIIEIIDSKGKMNHNALHYKNMDRFDARKMVIEELKKQESIQNITKVYHNIGRSERTNAIVEPRLSEQWFLRMSSLVTKAKQWVKTDIIKFHPERYKNSYINWLDNIKDWCISRQLYWGHRIPVFYLPNGSYIVAHSYQEALTKAKKITENITEQDLKQDNDVLDTWFSAWLWPIEVFNGISNPSNLDFNYYYPTNDLVTAPEIIFFWVARMIVAGDIFTNKPPFKNVYFTGIVRDEKKRKMSKSLGNSPNPIDLVDQYGADGVRMGLLLCSTAGNDLLFDEKLCKQGTNFANKLWNAFLFIDRLQPSKDKTNNHEIAISWIKNRFNVELENVNKYFDSYEISKALMCIYKFIWDDFCSLFLEMIKPKNNNNISINLINETKEIFGQILKLIHPFMPFISEELFAKLKLSDELITISKWPETIKNEHVLQIHNNNFTELIRTIRNIKNINNIKQKELIEINYKTNSTNTWIEFFSQYIEKMTTIKINPIETKDINNCNLMIGNIEFFVKIPKKQIPLELEKINKELKHLKSFKEVIEKKLENKQFLSNAKKEVIENEEKKLNDSKTKITLLQKRLATINKLEKNI